MDNYGIGNIVRLGIRVVVLHGSRIRLPTKEEGR